MTFIKIQIHNDYNHNKVVRRVNKKPCEKFKYIST